MGGVIFTLFKPTYLKYLKLFKTEALLCLVIISLSFILSLRTGTGLFSQQYLHFIWFIETFVAPLLIIRVFNEELLKLDIIQVLVITGAIGAFISVLLILNPAINDYVRNTLISYSGANIERFEFVRGYGIAENLLGSYSMIQGILMGLLFYLISGNIWYTLFLFPYVISIAFNARTGLLSIPISIILLLLFRKFSFRFLKIIISTGIILFVFFQSDNEFIEKNQETFNWLLSGYEILIDNINGDFSSGATATLVEEEKFEPANFIEFTFGTGYYGDNNGSYDNGYYHMLWYGGFLFLSIQLLITFFMFYRLVKIDSVKYIPFLFFILLLFFNIKWTYLVLPSGISRLIGFYYVWKCVSKERLNFVEKYE